MSDTPITDPFRSVSMKSKSPLDDLYWQYAALLESHEKLELSARMAARPEGVPTWTSVKDRLPPDFEEVLLEHLVDDHEHTIDIAWSNGGDWSFPWIGRLAKADCAPVWPLRWMALPQLPQHGEGTK